MDNTIIDAHVVDVGFGFYTAKEVKALSVKQLTSSVAFDNLNQPVPNGLYDPALGPIDRFTNCVTCGLAPRYCPGHLAHIELSVPCYHPLLFNMLYKLLRAQCFCCHRFRISRPMVLMFAVKLQLLSAGRVLDVQEVDKVVASVYRTEDSLLRKVSKSSNAKKKKKKKKSKGGDLDDDDDMDVEAEDEPVVLNVSESSAELEKRMAAALKKLLDRGSNATAHATSHAHSLRKDVIKQFFSAVPTRKCANCRGHTPRIRRDGYTKIFANPLSQSLREVNASLNTRIEEVFSGSVNDPLTWTDTTANSDSDDDDEKAQEHAEEDEAQSAPRLLFPHEVRTHMKLLWEREEMLLKYMWGAMLDSSTSTATAANLAGQDYNIFFLQTLPVPAARWRPAQEMAGQTFEHPMNYFLGKILQCNHRIVLAQQGVTPQPPKTPAAASSSSSAAAMEIDSEEDDNEEEHISDEDEKNKGVDMNELTSAWLELQNNVNSLIDSSKSNTTTSAAAPSGVRQLLEKKAGLFRKFMMGKRVNFAARSVISPDPYLLTSQIGVPERFATSLTYAEAVMPWNEARLRQAVLNGAHVHPGANFVTDHDGNRINLAHKSAEQRQAIANTLLSGGSSQVLNRTNNASGTSSNGDTPSVQVAVRKVFRHMVSGDVVLMNRQPTLHKPSIMAHIVRVLKGKEHQTLRMHYANCNTYNADFDGDEMNLHFPQDPLGRAEAYEIVNTDNQYNKPTDGTPLRGLIQDHVVSGVLLTQKDTFFERAAFQQLLYAAISEVDPNVCIPTPPPAIWKPKPLWTGKQVITAVLEFLTKRHDKPPMNMIGKTKVPATAWKGHVDEAEVVVRCNHLVSGVLDKSQFGASKFGLVHCAHELFGGKVAGLLLSLLGRLFTIHLHSHGFTCGIEDLTLIAGAEQARKRLVTRAYRRGAEASAKFAGLAVAVGAQDSAASDDDDDVDMDQDDNKAADTLARIVPGSPLFDAITRALKQKLESKLSDSGNAAALLDGSVKGTLSSWASKIIGVCLPGGQSKQFPLNMMSLMTLSGAKGSIVNFSQISCLLGQQELEGRRVPAMVSGKTLPSFLSYDPSPRAGGFVTDRFLTGLRPQEYYFHCMAGREGLVDTAVKTSRSGYLQRCLVKHLESLVVSYDNTVRDSADGTVVQFAYGEDSLDVSKSIFLKRFDFLASNYKSFIPKLNVRPEEYKHLDTKAASKYVKKYSKALVKSGGSTSMNPVLSELSPGCYLGSTSEKFRNDLSEFIAARERANEPLVPPSVHTKDLNVTAKKFRHLMFLNYMNKVVHPGEAVGVLAAQSVGEPSTQMTLNTFHLAGHGGANVTLGIPRLREIIMTAAKTIKTPIMELPMKSDIPRRRQQAERIANVMQRLRFSDFVQQVSVSNTILPAANGTASRIYSVELKFLSMKSNVIKSNSLTFRDFERSVELAFAKRLNLLISKELKKEKAAGHATLDVQVQKPQPNRKVRRPPKPPSGVATMQDDDNDADVDEDDEEEEKQRKQAKAGFDEPDADEQQLLDAGDDGSSVASNDVADDDEKAQDDGSDDAMSSDEEAAAAAAASAVHAKVQDQTQKRIDFLVNNITYLRNIEYKRKGKSLTALLQYEVPVNSKKLLMMTMVKDVCSTVVLKATPNIGECFVVEKSKQIIVQTNGINFQAAWAHWKVLDVDNMHSNDIGAILRTYGVEAARAAIVREIRGVFDVYGISVDVRHLGLLADYMTLHGGYTPLNRIGIDSNVSPFQKMSFETSTKFLVEACTSADHDTMRTPSARLVMGLPIRSGTGAFDLLHPLT